MSSLSEGDSEANRPDLSGLVHLKWKTVGFVRQRLGWPRRSYEAVTLIVW